MACHHLLITKNFGMKINKILGILVLGLLWSGKSYAGWFDPYIYGCVFQGHNN